MNADNLSYRRPPFVIVILALRQNPNFQTELWLSVAALSAQRTYCPYDGQMDRWNNGIMEFGVCATTRAYVGTVQILPSVSSYGPSLFPGTHSSLGEKPTDVCPSRQRKERSYDRARISSLEASNLTWQWWKKPDKSKQALCLLF
jgi:hypothetical protein